jgi:hypothetical protein
MAEPTVFMTVFNDKTQELFLNSGRNFLGHRSKFLAGKVGDVIVLGNNDTKKIFGIVVLGEFDNGKVYREHNLLDEDIYTGTKYMFEKFDIKIGRFVKVDIPFEDIAILCGKPADDKHHHNIWKRSQLNYVKPFYKGEDEELVVKRFSTLIKTLLSVS